MFKQEYAQFLVQPSTRNNSCLIKFPKMPVSVYSNGAKGPLHFHCHDNRTPESYYICYMHYCVEKVPPFHGSHHTGTIWIWLTMLSFLFSSATNKATSKDNILIFPKQQGSSEKNPFFVGGNFNVTSNHRGEENSCWEHRTQRGWGWVEPTHKTFRFV